jgi:hypothetical protein
MRKKEAEEENLYADVAAVPNGSRHLEDDANAEWVEVTEKVHRKCS